MLYNSFTFIASFVVVVVVYYALPHRFRWPFLLLISLGFYATFEPAFVLILLVFTLVTYLGGLAIGAADSPGRRKAILALGLVLVLGALFGFKYYNFATQSISTVVQAITARSTPLFPTLTLLALAGLSFYSFSCASYLVDVYRERLIPERHIGRFALYVAFFPKLLAGPIERATTFLPQLLQPVHFNPVQVSEGLQLILWGLFKKVVIADRLAIFVDSAYQQPAFASPADLLIATYFFTIQIYCDFSGYSDIAIGLAKVLGFDLMENFRRPLLSASVSEFWADRWHISLAHWFRDYLYFPLGGSRVPKLRYYFNLMAVFMVSGLWHGANWTFVVWGAVNGAYVVVGRMIGGLWGRIGGSLTAPRPLTAILSRLVTFHLILAAWVFFRAATIGDALTVFTRIAKSLSMLPPLLARRLASGDMLLSLAFIVILLLVELLDEWRPFWQGLRSRPIYLRWAVYYLLLIFLIVFGTWGMREFVYMQF